MITISITEQHIKNGKRFSPRNCPIYLSFKEAFHNTKWEIISVAGIVCYRCRKDPDLNHTYLLPKHIKKWMHDFDGDRDVNPVSFQIDESELARPRPFIIRALKWLINL